MKKVLLATFALVALFASDAMAGCWRNNCRRSCDNVCETTCESACKPACAPSYKVVEEKCPQVPKCVKYVPVEGTPICYRTCRWACPAGYELAGHHGSDHKFTLDDSNAKRNY